MELLLADLNKENNKYLRKDIDGGILTDKYEIDRYKLQEYADVVDNLMLGNYNEFGDYEIQPDILNELLKCQKVIVDNYENILFVESINKINAFGKLNFAVKVINSEQQGYKTAVLELLEPIYKAKGYIENTQATIIKKINLRFNDAFKTEIYKQFNIVLIDGEGGKIEIEDEDVFKETIERKIRLLYVKKYLDNQQDFEICYKKNIEELSKTEEGKKVIEEYKIEEKVAEKYLKVEPDDYKSKNELLTKNIEIRFPIMPKPILENLTILNNKVVNNIQKLVSNLQKQQTKAKVKVKQKQSSKQVEVLKNSYKAKDRLDVLDNVLGL